MTQMFTVALIGPDGSGKTTISKRLKTELELPVRSIYMGVNMDSGDVMLPHMRLIRALRGTARGDVQDTSSDIETFKPRPKTAPGRLVASLRAALRVTNWLAEERYRLSVARHHTRRGRIVLFDRHFFVDFYASDIRETHGRRPLSRRLHGFVLLHLYPKPDLVVCLDAPAEVLYARKPEGTIERLRRTREECLALRDVFREFVVIDATLPENEVITRISRTIQAFHSRRLREGSSRSRLPGRWRLPAPRRRS